MTVKELIEILSTFDQGRTVIANFSGDDDAVFEDVDVYEWDVYDDDELGSPIEIAPFRK